MKTLTSNFKHLLFSLILFLITFNVFAQPCQTPAATAAPSTICAGGSAILTASGSGGTYFWYNSPTGGLPVWTGPVYATLPLFTTTTYYVQTFSLIGFCSSPRTAVTVTVIPVPAAPNATATPSTVCSGSTSTLSVTNPNGSYEWFDLPIGGAAIATGPGFTTPSLYLTTTYYVQNTINGCTGPRTPVTVSVALPLLAPLASASPRTVCAGGTSVLTAILPLFGNINWYDGSGNLIGNGGIITTPVLTANTTFWAEPVRGACAGPRTLVSITVIPLSTAPIVTALPSVVCAGNSSTLTATSTTPGSIYQWFTSPTARIPVWVGASYTTLPLLTTTTYYVQAVSRSRCTSPRTAVTITVSSPVAPIAIATPPTVCFGHTSTLSVTASGGTYDWFDVPLGGTAIGTGSTFTTPSLFTTSTIYVENKVGNCTSPRTPVTVVILPEIAVDFDVDNTNPVEGETANFTNTSTGASFYKWFVNGNPTSTNTDFSYQFNSAGVYIIRLDATTGGCVESKSIVIGIESNGCQVNSDEIIYEACETHNPPVSSTDASVVDRFNNIWRTPPAANQRGGGASGAQFPVTCGNFTFVFEDRESQLTGGFNDPTPASTVCPGAVGTLGSERINVVCAVFNYISSVINMPAGANLEIYFRATPTVGNGGNPLATGSPLFDNPLTNNFEGGYLQEHITTGVDPNSQDYDAAIYVDFRQRTINGNTFNIHSCLTCPDGAIDLYSIILHEATHALGFASFISSTGISSMYTATNNDGPYSIYDQFLQSASSTPLVNATATFSGLTGALTSGNAIINATGNTEAQPVYSPPGFDPGSSLSHLDDSRSCFRFVMRHSTSGGDDRRWTIPEIEILHNLGYSMQVPAPPNNHYPVVMDDMGPSTTPGGNMVCVDVLLNDIDADLGDQVSFNPNCGLDCSNPGLSVQIITGNGPGAVATINGNQICYTPPSTFVGTASIRYCVTDGNTPANLINISNCGFLYIDVIGTFCPRDPCNLVCNGDFEDGVDPCPGGLTFDSFDNCPSSVDNWCSAQGSPDIFVRSPCAWNAQGSHSFGIPNNFFAGNTGVGVNTYSPVNSNGSPNNRYAGFYYQTVNGGLIEGLYARLISPLQPGKNYSLSFWAYTKCRGSSCSNPIDGRILVALNNTIPNPASNYASNAAFSYYPFSNTTIQTPASARTEPINNGWTQFTVNFVPNINNLWYLIIEPEAIPPLSNFSDYIFIDDVRLECVNPPIEITKTITSAPNPSIGDDVTYSITVNNHGTNTLNNVQIDDVLPAGLTNPVGFSPGPLTHIFTTLNPGVSTVTLTATIDNTAPLNTPIENCVFASGPVNNCLNFDNQDNCVDFTIAASDIVVTKTVNPAGPVLQNAPVTYTVTVTNNGPADMTGISVEDILPVDAAYISQNISPPGVGTYTDGNGGLPVPGTSGILAIPVLNNGQSVSLNITVSYACGQTAQNCASLIALDGEDLNLGNNSPCVDIVISNGWPITAGGATQDDGRAIAVDANDNVFAGGSFQSATANFNGTIKNRLGNSTSPNAYYAKYDACGNLLWMDQYYTDPSPQGFPFSGGFVQISSIVVFSNGNTAVAGGYNGIMTNENNDFAFFCSVNTALDPLCGFLLVYDASGNLIDAESIENYYVSDMVIDQSNNALWLSGNWINNSLPYLTALATYLNGNFTVPFPHFGLTNYNLSTTQVYEDGINSIDLNTSTGDIIVFSQDDANNEVSVWSFDGTIYTLLLTGSGTAITAEGVVIDQTDNTMYVTGNASIGSVVALGNFTATTVAGAYIAKFDPTTSNVLWFMSVPFNVSALTLDDQDNPVVSGTFNGNFAFAGSTINNAGLGDALAASWNGITGAELWAANVAGGPDNDQGTDIAINQANGNIYVTGSFESTATFGLQGQKTSLGAGDMFITRDVAGGVRFKQSSTQLQKEINSKDWNVSVYPNPTDGNVIVQLKDCAGNSSEKVLIQIYNVYGQLIKNFETICDNDKKYELALNNYAKGVYLLKIQADDKVYSEKLVLQ